MVDPKQRYVVDEVGRRVAVLVDVEEYRKLIEALEEVESIRAYDEAKASGDEAIPFEQAVREIESQRPKIREGSARTVTDSRG